jgi:heptosyltransferase-2
VNTLIAVAMRCVAACMRLVAVLISPPNGQESVDRTDIAYAVRESNEILVIALAEVGDVVLLSPFFKGLRLGAPHARITAVVRPAAVSFLKLCPYIDSVIEYDPRAHRILRPILLPLRAWKFARRRLSAYCFDIAVMPRWDVDHHFGSAVALFSRARRRIAYSEHVSRRKGILNAGFDSLMTDVVSGSAGTHEVERHMALLTMLGVPGSAHALDIWLDETDQTAAQRELDGISANKPLVALGIGAADPKRRWPPARFAELGATLRDRIGAHIIVIGGPGDRDAQAAILGELGDDATALAGRLSLRESAAVLERCQLFVGNDSGPLHLAAAVGLPCVEISCHPAGADPLHNNAPERFAPWGVPAIVLRPDAAIDATCASACVAVYPHCILGVSVTEVALACESLIDTSRFDARIGDRGIIGRSGKT